MATTPVQTTYASVMSLDMYYEIHDTDEPLDLLHGALSAIGTSFGNVLPSLAKSKQVIAFQMQAHGGAADRSSLPWIGLLSHL